MTTDTPPKRTPTVEPVTTRTVRSHDRRQARRTATSRAATANAGGDRYQDLIGAASLTGGPLLMATGDLLHPKETADIAGQAAIVAEHATRWYVAHLLLLMGLLLFVPGLLTLTALATVRRPRVGYAARVLLVIGVAGLSATLVAEMLVGRLGSVEATTMEDLLDTMFSGPIAGLIIPAILAFFVGAALFAVPLIGDSGPLRWPAAVLLAGTLLILAEIISSQVLLSQIGNLLAWGGSTAFARLLIHGELGAPLAANAADALPGDQRNSRSG